MSIAYLLQGSVDLPRRLPHLTSLVSCEGSGGEGGASGGLEGDAEGEGAAAAHLAVHPDAAAVGLDGQLAERQAEAGGHPPLVLAHVELAELLEDPVEGVPG